MPPAQAEGQASGTSACKQDGYRHYLVSWGRRHAQTCEAHSILEHNAKRGTLEEMRKVGEDPGCEVHAKFADYLQQHAIERLATKGLADQNGGT